MMQQESPRPSESTLSSSASSAPPSSTAPAAAPAPPTEEEVAREKARKAGGSGSDQGVFSLNKPRDAADGMGKGVSNIAGGVLGGVAFMLAAPVKGAIDGSREGGSSGAAKGFAKGLGVGVMGGTAMCVGGAATGVVQIGRGMCNTPHAIKAISEGKEWDDDSKEWIVYDLLKENDRVMAVSFEEFVQVLRKEEEEMYAEMGQPLPSSQADTKSSAAVTVSDQEFYDILGVPTNATTAEVKKAYYQKARLSHPDRHPDDPQAQAKFQKIGEAYTVLSDEKLRQNYDLGGKGGVEGMPKMDSGTLFAMIFGSEKFDVLVGELQLASDMSGDVDDDFSRHPRARAFRQKRREVSCAMHLAAKLQPYIDSNCNESMFRQSLQAEIAELSSSPFGGVLLQTIGDAYSEHARAELDTLDSMLVTMKQVGRNMSTKFDMLRSGINAAFAASALSKMQKKLDGDATASSAGTASTAGASSSASSATNGASSNTNTNNSSSSSSSTNPDSKSSSGPAGPAGSTEAKGSQDSQDSLSQQREAEAMKGRMKDLGTHMFQVMWLASQLDIRSTLAKVGRKVTRDCSVDGATRTKRKQALKVLGEEFSRGGAKAGGSVDTILAMMMAQAHGEDPNTNTNTNAEAPSSANTNATAGNTNTNTNTNTVYAKEIPPPAGKTTTANTNTNTNTKSASAFQSTATLD